MRSTGIEYSSTERTPTVLPELLPPLTGEQLAALEADLLANGCYSPIIVNEDLVVVDGHNRLELCRKHDIPYKIVLFFFADILEAKQWALDTQKGRRNLDKWELGKNELKLRPDVEARTKANQSAAGGDKFWENRFRRHCRKRFLRLTPVKSWPGRGCALALLSHPPCAPEGEGVA